MSANDRANAEVTSKSDLPLALAPAGLTPVLVVWTNADAGVGRLYRSQHRLLPLFKKASAAPVNNSSDVKRGRHRTNHNRSEAPAAICELLLVGDQLGLDPVGDLNDVGAGLLVAAVAF